MRKLSGSELLELRAAIVSSIADANDLDELVLYSLDKRLNQIVPPDGWDATVRKVLHFTEARGITGDFVAAAIQRSPKNAELRAIASTLDVDDGAGRFERIVKAHLGFNNVDEWTDGLIASKNAVCRIEQGGEGIGTGFLVGPSTVMTNWHVTHDDQKVEVPSGQLTFRFDYKVVDGKETRGVEYGDAGNVYVEHDETLDFSMIRLPAPAGKHTLGNLSNAPPRGWLKPRARLVQMGDPLMIIQHPFAWPQKFALGNVADGKPPLPDSQVYHDVSTERGSSGSPCFAHDWTLVALHFWGGAFNRAVLFSAILSYLNAKNVQLEQ